VIRPEHWDGLVAAVPALAGSRHATPEARVAHAGELADVLAATFAGGTAAEWFARLDGAGVPVEVADPARSTTWFDDPDMIANGLVAD
jgi:crotonobetainyl-CoA:carnitine CoA-transferase CaiB-like acyl-CoA transferase